MTVIAWDGKTLAADKRTTLANFPHTTTKIVRAATGDLVAAAGDTCMCRSVREWFLNGADSKAYPDKDAKVDLVVVSKDGRVLLYSGGPDPVHIEDRLFATGSGRDFALSAMHFGYAAAEAVEFASRFDVNCGNGVDAMELAQGPSAGAGLR